MSANRLIILLLVFFLGIGLSPALAQSTWHVDAAAVTGNNDGTSWDDAYLDLASALAVASPADTIKVAQGTYVPGSGSLARTSTFAVPSGVTIEGGYAGVVEEEDADARYPSTFRTVLSGDLLGNDTPGFGFRFDNAFHVVSMVVSSGVVLDGLTIRGGHADGPTSLDRFGGGLIEVGGLGGPLTLASVLFTDNFALQIGGGAYVEGAAITMTRCEFVANRVEYPLPDPVRVAGGGAFFIGCVNDISESIFRDNELAWPLSSTAGPGFGAAGLALENSLASTVRRCRFFGNVATGGNVFGARSGGFGILVLTPNIGIISDCVFAENQLDANGITSPSGGGGALINGAVFLTNCRFVLNLANQGDGGGLKAEGGSVFNALFVNNYAQNGGGIAARVAVVNSTFWANLGGSNAGGALVEAGGSIGNSVLWANETPGTVQDGQVESDSVGLPPVSYSDVQGLSTLVGNGNIGAYPDFVDPFGPDGFWGTPDDDLQLLPSSPCVDAGNNGLVPLDAADLDGDAIIFEPCPHDMLHRLRFHDCPGKADTGSGFSPLVDMGAFELGALPSPGGARLGSGGPGLGFGGGPDLTGRGLVRGPGDKIEATQPPVDLAGNLFGQPSTLRLSASDRGRAVRIEGATPGTAVAVAVHELARVLRGPHAGAPRAVIGGSADAAGELTLSLPGDLPRGVMVVAWQETNPRASTSLMLP